MNYTPIHPRASARGILGGVVKVISTIITNDPEFKLIQHLVPVIWLSEK